MLLSRYCGAWLAASLLKTAPLNHAQLALYRRSPGLALKRGCGNLAGVINSVSPDAYVPRYYARLVP